MPSYPIYFVIWGYIYSPYGRDAIERIFEIERTWPPPGLVFCEYVPGRPAAVFARRRLEK